MDLWTVLRHLEELEGRMADLYERFSRQFHEDKEAAGFFYSLSLEEISHRDLIRYERRLVSKNPGLFSRVEINIEEIREACAKIEGIIGSDGPFSLKQAVLTSLGFEKEAAECHYRSVMTRSNPGVAGLLDSLCQADRDHVGKVTDFARSRGLL